MSEGRSKRSWLADLSVQWKFALVLAVMIGILLVLLGANTVTLKAADKAQTAAEELTTLINQTNITVRGLSRRQIALVRTLFSRTNANLGTYQAIVKEVEESLDKLRQMTAREPALRAAADRAAALNERWAQTNAAPMLLLSERFAAGTAAEAERDVGLEVFLNAELGETGSRTIATVLDQLISTANAQLTSARDNLRRHEDLLDLVNLVALAATLLAGIGAFFLTARFIARPLRELASLMERLADHDHSIVIPHLERRDEVGVIGRALNVFKTMAVATHESDWIKTGLGTLAVKLQEADDLHTFADDLLSDLGPRLDARVALFYVFDPDKGALELEGSYGYKSRDHVQPNLRLGDGLVGQCAAERKPILLSTVPDDYVRIQSGTGEARPRSIFILPIVNKDSLLGVLELASFEPFSGARQHLLEEATATIALSLDNLLRALETSRLLDQSRRQEHELRAAEEELRTQQEELRTTNEQLQQQSQRLIASEEELRVQAQELQASNAELQRNTDHLNQQKDQLETLQQETEAKASDLARANQYKSQFLANMSHELRTPLNSLLILSHDLAENHDGNLNSDQVEAASIIHGSGSNLLRLINEILDLSKVEAGKMDVAIEPVSIPAFAQRMERNFRHVALEKGLAFSVTVADDAPKSIATDDGKLEQITNNLLGNAFKFTADGSVNLTFAAANGGDALAVEVSDTGIGIPADKLETIFEAFEQVDASTRRQFGGTGLGLAISRSLAVLLGGDVTVESELGRGTRFRLVLPVGAPADVAAEEPEVRRVPLPVIRPPRPTPKVEDDREDLREGTSRILIVEDDPIFARTLVGLVRRKGYQAIAAGDGESGLALARTHQPTGILLDVMLPGMDGWGVIERLKQDATTRHIPVHIVSALDESRRGRELGAVGFLTKPVTAEDLSGALAVLTHFSSERQRRVLVVDDDPAARFAAHKLIAREGIDVAEASSGEDAVAMMEQTPFDCVVLDLGLPGMSGFEVLEHMAARDIQAPVVVYSGRDLTSEESLRLRSFTDSIVIKGALSPDRLLDEVSLFLHSVQHASKAVPAEPDGDLKGRIVLVVDDDMRNIYALAKVLRGKGMEVVLAQDGVKALAQLDERRDVEIVLMDIMMPVMDGYEAMAEIRKRPGLAKLPVIALTAKAMKDDREKCLAAGASDYLSKPIDVPRLLSLIRSWLPAK
ncbi:response regulator [Aquabacter sp. CN5-332]|uniref:response regulator n=1 Tax=Aquabacter sp. CN5-332 TaxID=3156608 RepID=UPI0032B5398C